MTPTELELKVNFLVDEAGRKTAAQMDMRTYRKLIRYLEDLEDIAILESAKKRGAKFRPYSEVRSDLKKQGLL